MPVNILVVDDHVLFREGLVSLLKSTPDFSAVWEAGTVFDAVDKARELKPDMILMDYNLPDGIGPDAAKIILENSPSTKIIFLTMYDSNDNLFNAIRSGAKGFLLKDVPFSTFLSYMRGVEQNEAAISPKMTLRILDEIAHPALLKEKASSGLSDFSTREIAILRELAVEASNQEIAAHLSLSSATVKNYIHRILTKLNMKHRQEAALFARQQGLRDLNKVREPRS